MLARTFCHIPGVGLATERRLWSTGVHSWDVLERGDLEGLSPAQRRRWAPLIAESRDRLARGDAQFFSQRLSSAQTWRLFSHFRGKIAYFDIETTGLGGPGAQDYVTTIALYDGREVRTYVEGQNLHCFGEDIRGYDVLVSYNGKCFDAPFILNTMGLRLDQAHIDLRYVLANLGYKGGLKGCERALGVQRGDLEGVDGFMAVLLWEEYRRTGRCEVLQTLLAYNVQDVLNLERLMVFAYNACVGLTPFGVELAVPEPDAAPNPFTADVTLIRRLSGRMVSAPRW